MSAEVRSRRPSGFAVRLATTVLLAAGVAAFGENALAAHLANEAVAREAVARVEEDVAAMESRAALSRRPLAEVDAAVRVLAARRDVRSVRLLRTGEQGSLGVVVRPDRDDVRVSVPVEVDGTPMTVRVVLDGDPIAARATDLRRGSLFVLGLGVLATVPLTLAFGGIGLIHRHRRVVREARVDRLTGLGSRWAFEDDLARRADAARRARVPLTLTMVDVSGIEAVRNSNGRRQAETLFTRAASVFRTRREEHVAYRVTGDGFAVIMPEVSADQARTVAETWPRRIAHEAGPLNADIGVCTLGETCPDAETLVIAAEARLEDAREHRAATEKPAAPATDTPAGTTRGTTTDTPTGAADPLDVDEWDLSWLTPPEDPRDGRPDHDQR
jgi:diguanylate cyclase (GGDEF)-like protein